MLTGEFCKTGCTLWGLALDLPNLEANLYGPQSGICLLLTAFFSHCTHCRGLRLPYVAHLSPEWPVRIPPSQSPAPERNLLSEEPTGWPSLLSCAETLPSSLTWASSCFNCLALDGSLEGTSQGLRTTSRSQWHHQFFFSCSYYRIVGVREF